MDTKVNHRGQWTPIIRKCLVGLLIALIGVIAFTVGASADGLLVGNVQADVFEYVEGTTTSIQDMLLTFDVTLSQGTANTDVLVWASNPIAMRTFDGVTTQNATVKTWTADTSDIDGLRLRLTLEQWINGSRKGLRLYAKVLQFAETEYSYVTENQSITIYGDNGGAIQCSVNILPYMLNIQNDVAEEDYYALGYQNGYIDGQNNPNTAIKEAIRKQGYDEGVQSNTAYIDGYNQGASDVTETIEISGLAKPTTAIGILTIPLNAIYRAVNNVFNGLYNNPIGAVIMFFAGIAIVIAVIVGVGKFFL